MASIPTIAGLREDAASLGLVGDAISEYVYKQQDIARDERSKERELEKAKLEDQQKQRDHEIRLLELKAQRPSAEVSLSDAITRPKLPLLKDGEDISAYLVRFERIAEMLKLDKATYAVHLGTLLGGRAVKIYASLSPRITGDFELLKKALLVGFNKTPESYRQEFRSIKIGVSETYEQFAIQLGRVLDFWLESRTCEKSFEGVRSFFLADQFLASVPSELRLFIKEHDVHTVPEIAKLADNWTMARGAYPKEKKQMSVTPATGAIPKFKVTQESNKMFPLIRDPKSNKCFSCGAFGHRRASCPKNPLAFSKPYAGRAEPANAIHCCLEDRTPKKFLANGTVNGARVSTILRDTGCSSIIVAEEVLPNVDVSNSKYRSVSDYLGRKSSWPVVRCYIRCPYYCGWIDALRAPIKFCSVLIGNVPGVVDPWSSDLATAESGRNVYISGNRPEKDLVDQSFPVAVVTRSNKRSKTLHPLVLAPLEPLDVTPQKFIELQQACPSLSDIRAKTTSGESVAMKSGCSFRFVFGNGLLYRECVASNYSPNIGKKALIVPDECRKIILSVAHESPLAGHFSHRKTESRVREHFFWPGIGPDIKNYCRSCDKCQRMSVKGNVKRVPLVKMPIITEPFSRVSIDLVGPLSPSSVEGHKYILTLIDSSTGFPEAIPLKEIDSISVAEALLLIFSRVGIPREILSDRGAQFTSQLMGELHRLLGVKSLFCTPYHPMGNGRIERFHATLKASLRKLCADKPRDWHRYLIPTLFALRELPSDRTGFSAFELLYGRQVRGPITVLRDLWEDSSLSSSERPLFQYVIELRDKLEECSKIAAQNANISANRYKTYFDLKSQDRQFSPGDEVLVLLPDTKKKLLMSWSGPHPVLERRNRVNYLIDQAGTPKLYHANLLRKYHRRAIVGLAYLTDEIPMSEVPPHNGVLDLCQHCVIEDYETDNCSDDDIGNGGVNSIQCIPTVEVGTDEMPDIYLKLSEERRSEISELLVEYKDTMSSIPGCTDTIVHDIELTTEEPFKSKLYPVPIHLQSHLDAEVDKLLDLGIIKLSKSPHCSPVVLVKKPDNSYRLTVDYRSLNSVSVFHAEPACNAEEDLHKFAGARYFSELDITRAYHQIPLTDRAKRLTAFPTKRGLMEYCRLPFGLVGACATYARLMRLVLHGLPDVCFYFDNIFVYSTTWSDHLIALRNVLLRLRQHGLTARPSKCKFGFESLKYLGFEVGINQLKPQMDKVAGILKLTPPVTKKALRSFLGMISFYRKFINHAASLTAPLSDMLRKGSREPLQWSECAINGFNKLKDSLSDSPILKLPDPNKTFILRTDASNFGLGAILLQYHSNSPHPVAYASRKLLDREKNYSTIEKECLAVIYGVNKFNYYLLGREFILEVDHKPLVYLNKVKSSNSRLMRWALSLQPYRFRVLHVSGEDNIGADLLSRSDT